MCTPLMSVEFEDYEAKKEIKERRGDPTWLKTHGDRPHHTLGLPRPQKPLPSKHQSALYCPKMLIRELRKSLCVRFQNRGNELVSAVPLQTKNYSLNAFARIVSAKEQNRAIKN